MAKESDDKSPHSKNLRPYRVQLKSGCSAVYNDESG
jgi:hypothetical protein